MRHSRTEIASEDLVSQERPQFQRKTQRNEEKVEDLKLKFIVWGNKLWRLFRVWDAGDPVLPKCRRSPQNYPFSWLFNQHSISVEGTRSSEAFPSSGYDSHDPMLILEQTCSCGRLYATITARPHAESTLGTGPSIISPESMELWPQVKA